MQKTALPKKPGEPFFYTFISYICYFLRMFLEKAKIESAPQTTI